jgi:predicted NBD/HSP70 family sugar kinase
VQSHYSDRMIMRSTSLGSSVKISNADIRSANVREIYRAIREGGSKTRSELTAATGLALPTVSAISRFLLDEGLVEEVLQGTTARGGRPPSTLKFSSGARLVATIRFAGSDVEAVAADLEGRVIAKSRADRLSPDEPWSATADAFCRQVRDLLQSANITGPLGGLALCVPGAANRLRGTWTRPGHPGWADVPIVDYLSDQLHVPSTIANTTASALVGQLVAEATEPASAMMLWVSRGVGSATVVAGSLVEGATGSAGEIGHSPLRSGDALCECGRRGCVTTATSVPYMRSQYERLTGTPAPTTLLEMEAAASREVEHMLDQVADDLAYAASWGVNLVNPAVLYFGGNPFMDGETRLFAEFSARLARYSHQPNFQDLIVRSANSDDVASGAIAIASELLPELLRPRNRALSHLMPGLGSIDNPLYKTLA